MSAKITLESLFGAYNPEELSHSWIQSFFGANVTAICDQLIPGEKVQCISSDTLYLGYALNGDKVISYVPVSGTGEVIPRGSNEKVAVHYFITRPESIGEFAKNGSLDIDKPNPVLLMVFWDILARQIRGMIQVKFASRLVTMSFGTLFLFNLNPHVIVTTQQVCINTCRSGGLTGDDRLLCMDQFCAATFGSANIAQAIREGDVDVTTLPTIISRAAVLGLT